MEGFQLNNIFDLDISFKPKIRTKSIKRKWREIEAINDRRNLLKELQELDASYDITLEDIKL